jgi:prepilin-type N-terminal cleavage/methylation domain-containing protein
MPIVETRTNNPMKGLKLMKVKSTQNSLKRGFTILEMLTVIAVISIMAVVAIAATNNNAAGTGSKQGAIIASTAMAFARSEAIQKQDYAVLIIDAYQDSSNPGNFLHRMMIADSTTVPGSSSPNGMTQASVWYDLPNNVYFDPSWSTPTAPVQVSISNSVGQIFNGSAYAYTFTPVGQLATAGQMVLAVGHEGVQPSIPHFEDGTSGTQDTRQGFYLHLLGRPSFFPNPASIPTSSH